MKQNRDITVSLYYREECAKLAHDESHGLKLG